MTELTLGFPFTDGMVLQQGRSNLVWGRDRAGQRVTLFVEGAPEAHVIETVTGDDGRFRLSCPLLPAGGPYRLVVEGSKKLIVDDVMCGEVWLASGQSNMEWPLSASQNADAEIDAANDPLLRVLKVKKQTAWEPEERAEGCWEATRPDTAASFTAVGYFFARELRRSLGVPVGIIDCTWGGTTIAAWTSVAGQRSVHPEVDEEIRSLLQRLPELSRLRAEHDEVMGRWERSALPSDPPHTGVEKGYARPEFDHTDWGTMKLPAFWQHHGMKFNGVVWFRRSVDIPEHWRGRDLSLGLGAIDDFDHTYFDGELVGAHPKGTPEAFQIPRRYVVPGHLVRPGKTVIAVRVFDHFGQGGFAGPRRAMSIAPVDDPGDSLALSGAWRIFAEHPIPLVPDSVWATFPRPPLLLTPEHRPGALHNGMLAPLIPYGLRGFLWYQGESDVERHAQYATRQVALVRDLLARFDQGTLPFLFVELAGFRGGRAWPYLREAQQRASAERGTGMVSARDLGDPHDIHPRNKHEVGRRLALLARSSVYGETLENSGPRFERVEMDRGAARIWFRSESPLRSSDGTKVDGFELAGSDGRFHRADARLDGDCVVATSPSVPRPQHVRYAFSDTGEGDLTNATGLPALSFRTDDFEEPPAG